MNRYATPGRRPAVGRAGAAVLGLVLAAVGIAGPLASPAAAAGDTTEVPLKRIVPAVTFPIADISPRGNGGQFNWQIKLDDGTGWGYDPCLDGLDTYNASCLGGGSGYYRNDVWTAGDTSAFTPSISVPNATGGQNHQWANRLMGARIEIYPNGPGGEYDPWTQNVGGVAINAFSIAAGGAGANLGTINLPTAGGFNVGRLGGSITSSTAVGEGRVVVDAFQEHSEYDPYPYATTSTGFDEGGFASTPSKGAAWTTGWNFNGQYHLFVTDTKGTGSTADDVKIQVNQVMLGDTVLPIDLDAPCFGFDECAYDSPAPYAPVLPTGGYHPVTPARIMDTRDGTGRLFGIPGAVTQGDGALGAEPNPTTRLASQLNHEAWVTGVGGVPKVGVSAVVLNVTVTQPTNSSFLTVYPKPPRINANCPFTPLVYCDQASFGPGTTPLASNLNFTAGQTVPNLVVVRVGAGGKVRMKSNTGSTHVIFDVVGWFDTGAVAGDAFTGVTPTRLMDTRAGSSVGPYATPFDSASPADQDRALTVTGGSVPADASAVVVNVTAIGASAASHLTVYPDGVARPGVSNLNFGPGQVVPNLVMVKVGAGGRIRIFGNTGRVDVIVDVVGYYRASGGGLFRPLAQPTRILDSRTGLGTGASPFGPAETRTLQVGGVGGVPGGATAVIMNVTVTGATSGSHLTAYPADVTMPTASNLNFSTGQTVPNLVMVKLSPAGAVNLFNNAGSTHVIADVAGYIT